MPSVPAPAAVRWGPSRHARRLITLALGGLIIAVVTGRPEFAGAAAPAAMLLVAWRPGRPSSVGVAVRLTARHLVEGDTAAVVAALSGHGDHTAEFRIAGGGPSVLPGAPVIDGSTARLPFQVSRWGRRELGTLEIVLRDRWRLAEGHVAVHLPMVECNPLPARQVRQVLLRRLPSQLGEHPSPMPGDGVEFTGIREFVPGDRQRRINWPATTRLGSLQLNTFAAERAQTVVAIVDASSDVGQPGSSSVDLAYRAATGITRSYLAARDRVGLILLTEGISWIGPGTGERHFHRVLGLLMARPGGRARMSGLVRLPQAALPPGALILVFSPLLDHRLVEALRDLRERGFAVLVVDVLNVQPSRHGTISQLTWRIWRMEQDAIRFSLRELGIPVAHWDGRQQLDAALAPYTRRPVAARR